MSAVVELILKLGFLLLSEMDDTNGPVRIVGLATICSSQVQTAQTMQKGILVSEDKKQNK